MADPITRRPEVKFKPKWITFEWKFRGYEGEVHAVTFSGAVEFAHKDYLRKCNIGPQMRNYRTELQQLKDKPFRISIGSVSFSHYAKLYRNFQQGEHSKADDAELAQFQSIIRDKEAYNARHFQGQ
jgi:hypothetical protein